MKPHPRIRKTIKWGGAAVTVLLVVVWVGSGWLDIALDTNDGWLRFYDGSVQVVSDYSRTTGIYGISVDGHPWRWSNSFYDDRFTEERRTGVPLWPLVLVSVSVTAVTWRLDTLTHRRAKLNLCAKCGYDRTGLSTTAVCPECGSPSAPNK